jgi:hypothetical protein
MIITRCDECKKLSDEPNIGYIGRKFAIKTHKQVFMTITTHRDLCKDCLQKLVAENSPIEDTDY